MIKLGVDLEDGIIKAKQNFILKQLRKNNFVDMAPCILVEFDATL